MNRPPIPKMSRKQAKILWNSMTPAQRFQLNEMLQKMENGELKLEHVNVSDDEQIQNITLVPKEKKSVSATPFYKYFAPEK